MEFPHSRGEETLLQYVDARIDSLSLSDLVRIARLSESLGHKAKMYMKTFVYKIVLSTDHGGVNMRIYTKQDRKVYSKTAPFPVILRAIRYLKEVGIHPFEIDVKNYNHEPRDNILDVINNFVSGVKKVAMSSEKCCKCNDECLRLDRMMLGDVYCISPPALMFTQIAGVNELHIDAGLPSRCVDLLHNLYHFSMSPTEIFAEFKRRLTMLARSLTISDIDHNAIRRDHFGALLEQMKVEELHLVPGPLPAPQQRPPNIPRGFPWFPEPVPQPTDLKFAETQGEDRTLPIVHWNTNGPKMPLLRLFYRAAGSLPCTEIVRKLSAWFSIKRLLEVFLPKKRTTDELISDSAAMLPLLKAFGGDEIKIRWHCERNEDKVPRYHRLCTDIAALFKEDFTVKPNAVDSEEWFVLDLLAKDGTKKTLEYVFTVATPPPPVDLPALELARAERRAVIEHMLAMAARRHPERRPPRLPRRHRAPRPGDFEEEEEVPAFVALMQARQRDRAPVLMPGEQPPPVVEEVPPWAPPWPQPGGLMLHWRFEPPPRRRGDGVERPRAEGLFAPRDRGDIWLPQAEEFAMLEEIWRNGDRDE